LSRTRYTERSPMDRTAWIESLFSTEPADRPRAEAAARALYRALDLEGPPHIFWFDNPSAGAWAAAVLLSSTLHGWARIVADVERDPEQRPAVERARERLGQINAGPSLTGRLTGKCLFTDRLSLYPDLPAFQRASIFTDDDDLYRAENQFRGPRRGVAGFQESAGRAGGLIHASQLSVYTMSQMAADEAQAAGGSVPHCSMHSGKSPARRVRGGPSNTLSCSPTAPAKSISTTVSRRTRPMVPRWFTAMAGRSMPGKAKLSLNQDRPSRYPPACKNGSCPSPFVVSPRPRVFRVLANHFWNATAMVSTKRLG
jgi:hypothetical protein